MDVTSIRFALYLTHGGPIIKLENVCETYFGIAKRTAVLKVKAGQFPVPTFRLDDAESQRIPLMITIDDLAEYIVKRHALALEEWQAVNEIVRGNA